MKDYKQQFIWKKAKDLAVIIYRLTKHYPVEEKYGLVSQMNRCAVSIPSNIAEGYARPTTKDYLRFLYIALGSARELETQLIISKEIQIIDNTEWIELVITKVNEVVALLVSTINKLK
jgi:four helix bundle protein